MATVLSLGLAVGVALLWAGCGAEDVGAPRPHAFPRVPFPRADSVHTFRAPDCPFRFSVPSYVSVERDTAFFDEAPKHPCWFDLVTPSLNGRVHVSYYPLTSTADFERHRDDAYTLVGKHNVVASYIDEQPIDRPGARVWGYGFAVEGEAASPYQLFVTDSTRHFLRAAVYVNAQARPDSLAPVYEFLRRDLLAVIESLRWEG